ncbi:hypothetical protein [Chryseobacterium timonianum]|uniref:hypothetical protein n=1 Tax=Chryseobacterium timonianum TaxID=1805473 RepID=UPI001F4B9F79|nr:hypothetical protein [Chryseobacterium timonianum]
MEKEKLEQLGYYLPGFLRLTINSNIDFSDLNKVMTDDKKEFSTFLHEYIHFLQNITTVHGLYLSIQHIDIILYAVAKVRREDEEFIIPVDLSTEVNFLAQAALRRLYLGDGNNINAVLYQAYRSENVKIQPEAGESFDQNRFIADCINYNGYTNEKYVIGSTAIKEFVAYSIQNKFFLVDSPDTPYKIVDLIISKEVPELADKLDLKIMMCEASLMTFHPAETLFAAIEKLKKAEKIPVNPREIYDFVIAVRDLNVSKMFDDVYSGVIEKYNHLFQSEIYKGDLHWLKTLLERAKLLRNTEPDFLIKLVSDSGNLTHYFSEVLDSLGTPFFTNKELKGYFIPPKDIENEPSQPYLLNAVAEVMHILYGQSSCGMLNFCNQTEAKPTVNEQCTRAPWEKMTDYGLCPFCQIWKTFGLNEKQPNVKRK